MKKINSIIAALMLAFAPVTITAVGLSTVSVTMFLNGCAGTNPQRIILASSSAVATTVNAAYDLWAADAAAKAKAILGPQATPEQVVAEVKRSDANQKVMAYYDEWRTAMLAYSAANAAATSGTNSVVLSTEAFRIQMARAGNALLSLISQLTGKPQPALVP